MQWPNWLSFPLIMFIQNLCPSQGIFEEEVGEAIYCLVSNGGSLRKSSNALNSSQSLVLKSCYEVGGIEIKASDR